MIRSANRGLDTTKAAISLFLLSLYLFGFFVTNILHPLHHCHCQHDSDAFHATSDINCSVDVSTGNRAIVGETEYCICCCSGYSNEFIVEFGGKNLFIQVASFLFENVDVASRYDTFYVHTFSRAPPFFIG